MSSSWTLSLVVLGLTAIAVTAIMVIPVHAETVLSNVATNDVNSFTLSNTSNGGLGDCFQASSSATITRVTFDLSKASGTTGTLSAEVWSTSGNPASHVCSAGTSRLYTSSNTVQIASLTVSPTFSTVSFTFSSASITSGSSYIVDVVLTITAGTNVFLAANNLALPANTFVYEDYQSASTTFATSGDENPCSSASTCVAYTLYGNVIAPTLCSTGMNGAIIGAEAFVMVMAVIAVGILKSGADGHLDAQEVKVALGIVVTLSITILLVTIILGTAPAGGPC